MKKDETRKIRRILYYLKIIRKFNNISYRAAIFSDEFEKSVIKPLEEISGWNENKESNEKLIDDLAKGIKGGMEEKRTFKRKREYFNKILKITEKPKLFQKIVSIFRRKK